VALESLTDEALVLLVARGEEDALRELVRRYGGAILGLARRMGLDPATREDCLQEVVQRIWKGASGYDPRRTSAKSWLLAVAHHQAVDMVRRQAVRPQPLEPDPEEESFDVPGPGMDEVAILDRLRLKRALARLSPEEREVVEILYYQGYPHGAAAKRLGIPLGTLKTRARRALEKLKEVLDEP
jgi:RNA polymerase sigma-70 factor (ECF subfamily)